MERARDDAHAALRLSTRARQLPWCELDAYEAHAYLDGMEGVDHGRPEPPGSAPTLSHPASNPTHRGG